MTLPILYHYTTQAGLIGILDSRCLWASDLRYLNDASEVHHALDIASDLVDDLAEDRSGTQLEFLHTVKDHLRVGEMTETAFGSYVLSFSEEPDLLSQWRAYGGDVGFALGFEIEVDAAVYPQPEIRLARCDYERSTVEEGLREFLEHYISYAAGDSEEERRRYATRYASAVASMAPLAKHPTFEEEREWRVILTPAYLDQQGLVPRLRRGRVAPVPYVALPWAAERASFTLRSIVVGPSIEPDLAREALRTRLSCLGLNPDGDVEVRNSWVPYRSM